MIKLIVESSLPKWVKSGFKNMSDTDYSYEDMKKKKDSVIKYLLDNGRFKKDDPISKVLLYNKYNSMYVFEYNKNIYNTNTSQNKIKDLKNISVEDFIKNCDEIGKLIPINKNTNTDSSNKTNNMEADDFELNTNPLWTNFNYYKNKSYDEGFNYSTDDEEPPITVEVDDYVFKAKSVGVKILRLPDKAELNSYVYFPLSQTKCIERNYGKYYKLIIPKWLYNANVGSGFKIKERYD